MHFSKRIALRGINKGLVINDNRDNIPLAFGKPVAKNVR